MTELGHGVRDDRAGTIIERLITLDVSRYLSARGWRCATPNELDVADRFAGNDGPDETEVRSRVHTIDEDPRCRTHEPLREEPISPGGCVVADVDARNHPGPTEPGTFVDAVHLWHVAAPGAPSC